MLRKGAEEAVEEETKEEEEEELKEEERKFAEETMEEGHGRREAEEACYRGDAGGGSSSGSPARARSLTPVWSPTRLQRPEASAEQHPSAFGAVSPRATQPPCSEATRLPRHGFMDAPGAEDRAEEAAAAAAARGQSRRQARVPEPSQEITSRPPAPKQMRLSKQRPNKDSSGSGDEVDSGPLEPSVDHDSTKSDDQVVRCPIPLRAHCTVPTSPASTTCTCLLGPPLPSSPLLICRLPSLALLSALPPLPLPLRPLQSSPTVSFPPLAPLRSLPSPLLQSLPTFPCPPPPIPGPFPSVCLFSPASPSPLRALSFPSLQSLPALLPQPPGPLCSPAPTPAFPSLPPSPFSARQRPVDGVRVSD